MYASGEANTGTIQRVMYSDEETNTSIPPGAHNDQTDITERMSNPPTEGVSVTSERKTPVYYRVRRGDTLHSIARQQGTTVADIKRLNGIKGDQVKPGQRIKVGQRTATAQNRKSPSGSRQSASRTYRVRQGDTLSSIAKVNNVSVENLRTANNIKGNSIRPGQTLVLTTKASRSAQSRSSANHRRK
jgi:LysM repeat protein